MSFSADQGTFDISNIYVTISRDRGLEYVEPSGRSPYAEWFEELNAQAAAKVAVAVTRLGQGNFSNVKSVGSAVMEYKVNFGPGYRIYFGRDGNRLVILLGGGSKASQASDIGRAQARWMDYKRRKR